MRAPFYKVLLQTKSGDKDITEKVERVRFEDCIEEDSYANFTIRHDVAMAMVDDEDLQAGQIILFHFGFLGGAISPVHKVRVTDVSTKYKERVSLEIKCLDLGTVVKKITSDVIWENKTSIEIAGEIAAKYDLTLVSDTSTKKWDNLPQGNRSDMSLLQYMAAREEGGNWISYISGDKLYFVNRATEQPSKKTYMYGEGSDIIGFEASMQECHDKSKLGAGITMPTIDPTKDKSLVDVLKDYKLSVDGVTETKTGTTGDYKITFGVGAKSETLSALRPSKNVSDPSKDKKESTNLANSIKKSAGLKQLTGKLTTNGDPAAFPNEIITMGAVAKRHAGNWYVTKVTHDISTAGYLTTRDLNKNGVKTKGTIKATDANNTKGSKEGNAKVKTVRVFTGDGDFLGRSIDPSTIKKD